MYPMNNEISAPHIFATYFGHAHLNPYLFALYKKMQSGHICIQVDALPQDQDFWEDHFSEQSLYSSFPDASNLVGEGVKDRKPFVLHLGKLYTARNFFYESKIIDRLRQIVESEKELLSERMQKLEHISDFIKSMQSGEDLQSFRDDEKPDWQLIAALLAAMHNITIITGGPGTGKTTTVSKILGVLHKLDQSLKIALCAPTGKAALRMKESLLHTVSQKINEYLGLTSLVEGIQPSTIHRLLGAKRNSPFFKANESNPLDYDLIIVDESSMIGMALFAKLITALKPEARIILLGDSDQLASVDAGSFFGDLCQLLAAQENCFSPEIRQFCNQFLTPERQVPESNIKKDPLSFLDGHLVRLKKTYRYDGSSKLGHFTKAVIEGNSRKAAEIIGTLSDEESLQVDFSCDQQVFNAFVKHFSAYISEPDNHKALLKINEYRVLAAVREGNKGVHTLNKNIEQLLKKRYRKHNNINFRPSLSFYHNQPILITKNTPALGLFNGDVGLIRNSEAHNGRLMAFFFDSQADATHGSQLKAVNPLLISHWETVFAMTIHKSQGSEFKEVLVVIPEKNPHGLLSRELLYTALTRAKKKAILQVSEEVLQLTLATGVDRVSGIVNRILNG